MSHEDPHGTGEGTSAGGGNELRTVIGAASDRVQAVLDAAESAAAAILEEAEAEARQRIEESRARADRLTLERVRLMAELTDDLLEHAAVVKRQSDALIEALDSALRAIEERSPSLLEEEPGAEPAAEEEISAEREPVAPEGAEERLERGEPAADVGEGADDPLGKLRERILELRALSAPEAAEGGAAPGPEEPSPERPAPERPERRRLPSAAAAEAARLLATQMAVAGSTRDEIEARLRDEFGIVDAGSILDSVPDVESDS